MNENFISNFKIQSKKYCLKFSCGAMFILSVKKEIKEKMLEVIEIVRKTS
jgi:hypothetical protein